MNQFIKKMMESDSRLNQLFEGSPSFSTRDISATKDIYRIVASFLSAFSGAPGTPKVTPNFRTEADKFPIKGRTYHQHFIINHEIDDEVVAVLSLGRFEKEGGRDEYDAIGVFSIGEKDGVFQSEPGESWLHAVKRFVEMLKWFIGIWRI